MGKIGRANAKANLKIRKIVAEKNLNFCEIGQLGWPPFSNCMRNWPLQTAHRHKRAWYKGDPEKLSDLSQWGIACQVCHERIEHDKVLTEDVFISLRGHQI